MNFMGRRLPFGQDADKLSALQQFINQPERRHAERESRRQACAHRQRTVDAKTPAHLDFRSLSSTMENNPVTALQPCVAHEIMPGQFLQR